MQLNHISLLKRLFALLAIGGLIYSVYAPLRLCDWTEGAEKFSVDELPSFLKEHIFILTSY